MIVAFYHWVIFHGPIAHCQAEGGVFVSSQRNKISIVPSVTKTETTITTTSMKVAPSFGYRRSLRRGVARGNVYKLTICKFTAGLNDSILVQSK